MDGVSVVICCFNSEKRIRETLECIQSQIFKRAIPWEVIIVDNISSDNTKKIVDETWKKNPVTQLRIFDESIQGQTYARKKGVDNSHYDFVSFVDDDNRVDSHWVENVYLALTNHPDCAACNGMSTASFETVEPWWFKHFALNFAVGKQGDQSGYVPVERGFLFGAGLSVRKSSLLDLYERDYPAIQSGRLINDMRGGGEDSELCFCFLLCGYKLYYDEKIKFSHYMPASRMNETGLRRIQTSLGRDEVVLSMYRSMLNPGFNPKKKWWLEYLAYLKYYLRFLTGAISLNHEKQFLFSIKNVYHISYLNELIHLRQKYELYQSKIKAFTLKNKKSSLSKTSVTKTQNAL